VIDEKALGRLLAEGTYVNKGSTLEKG
jgi:hypothetical protein